MTQKHKRLAESHSSFKIFFLPALLLAVAVPVRPSNTTSDSVIRQHSPRCTQWIICSNCASADAGGHVPSSFVRRNLFRHPRRSSRHRGERLDGAVQQYLHTIWIGGQPFPIGPTDLSTVTVHPSTSSPVCVSAFAPSFGVPGECDIRFGATFGHTVYSMDLGKARLAPL
ncbi:hypothetical protein C8R46DRAFT_1209256 [Mycena filopes]|nr:hypothetical protein C8R46DRAFT_1209256 [Mycena filopes]